MKYTYRVSPDWMLFKILSTAVTVACRVITLDTVMPPSLLNYYNHNHKIMPRPLPTPLFAYKATKQRAINIYCNTAGDGYPRR